MKNNKHIFNYNIIREYDIRGKYGENLDERDAYFLGCSLSTYLKSNNINGKICIGYDGRKSSPKLKEALIRGFLDIGFDVIELGLVPTPTLYYACQTMAYVSAGVMVTASHNPKEDNGFKVVVETSPFFGNSLKKLCDIARSKKIKFAKSSGNIRAVSINREYIDKITNPKAHTNELNTIIPLKFVWDASNSVISNILKEVVARLPGKHIIINDKIDGNFPAHPPDPTKEENLQQAKEIIRKEKCDFGVVFDGDGDRLVLINNDFRVFHGDQLLAFFANDLLKRHPNAKIIADIKTSNTVFNEIKRLGGQPIIWKTGHSNIKVKMLEENAILAGEVSGHLFFKENYYGYDDALFTACKLIFLLSNKENKNYLINLPQGFVSPEIRLQCQEGEKISIIGKIKNVLDNMHIQYIALDGIKVENEKGWWLVRASNTEEALVIRCEGYSKHNFDFILEYLFNILQKVGIKEFPINFQ